MKKLTLKRRLRSIRANLLLRKRRSRSQKRRKAGQRREKHDREWLGRAAARGLTVRAMGSGRVILSLPPEMNFSTHYERTALNVLAIRRFTKRRRGLKLPTHLARVDFSQLREISTPAALVLTAELSKWDDRTRRRLKPLVHEWDAAILHQFAELGFFDLFSHSPPDLKSKGGETDTPVKLVKYIKGMCGESAKVRELREGVAAIVGDVVEKWMFLRGGLDEAITNVSHHAYPEGHGFLDGDKYWYLTGSYNTQSCELKIVFYDQGIGIPGSLPASDIWERALNWLSLIPIVDRKKDAVMIKAAVELDRSRTGEDDRGKGLQDLLEFIRQRGDGYLSIMSAKGLYKLSIDAGIETVKSEHFVNPIAGTLIIWCVTLSETGQART